MGRAGQSVHEQGYVLYAGASIVLAISANVLPDGMARVACWILLLPSVLAFPHLVRRYRIRMGNRALVIALTIMYGFIWLLTGGRILKIQLPYDQLYMAWTILFLVLVLTQHLIERRDAKRVNDDVNP